MKKIVLCGGGTGGHVFPNIAISELLKKQDCDLFYIGVNGKIEEKLCEENKIDFYGYDFSGFPRKLKKEILVWPFHLLKAVSKAKVYLKHFKPEVVFGTGGYSSAPVFIAAKRLNVPYIVHNLDVRFGLANKFCANGASCVTLGFPSNSEFLKNTPSFITGNPVRKTFLEIEKTDKELIFKELGLDSKKKTIFVIGGSQGANAINETILEILKELILDNNIQIIHQTGEISHEAFSKRIPASITTSYIAKSFFENPEKCYHIADLVIARSGAMTTTEITTLGKAAIFIPFPYAGNHQEANINHLIESGGAILLRQKVLNSKLLLSTILEIINNENKLSGMSKTTKSFAKPDAAEDIVKIILGTMENKNKKDTDVENLTSVI
jgi:UDP-N-acetylglucosamine--N-acetylmuramyl-(pentapeptide) pyrophosphoryl-undecaprenol N-acetylglucosamine transferase